MRADRRAGQSRAGNGNGERVGHMLSQFRQLRAVSRWRLYVDAVLRRKARAAPLRPTTPTSLSPNVIMAEQLQKDEEAVERLRMLLSNGRRWAERMLIPAGDVEGQQPWEGAAASPDLSVASAYRSSP